MAAAIEILEDFEARRVPLKTCLQDWARMHRFAGAKDRAWLSGLCLDALRKRNSLRWRMGADGPRAMVLGALGFEWAWPVEEIAAAAAEEPHGPGALTETERAQLESPRALEDAPSHVQGDYPDWLEAQMARIFGVAAVEEGAALAARAPVDLRVNLLKATPEKAEKALTPVKAEPSAFIISALRIPAPPPSERAGAVETIPAFGKGWVEVQDLGSQIAALAAGEAAGLQMLDLCAGGGGKTLALASAAGNSGQIYAYDADARRLAPIHDRLRRAGARNIQVRAPTDENPLSNLESRMDFVLVDAPCTGSGVWRRHPDTKWRLKSAQLEARMAEQDQALDQAAAYVKPGGRLAYVTCSLFAEENEDRLAAFRARHVDFAPLDAFAQIAASGVLTEAGRARLQAFRTDEEALRLTPLRMETDGFFIAVLRKRTG